MEWQPVEDQGMPTASLGYANRLLSYFHLSEDLEYIGGVRSTWPPTCCSSIYRPKLPLQMCSYLFLNDMETIYYSTISRSPKNKNHNFGERASLSSDRWRKIWIVRITKSYLKSNVSYSLGHLSSYEIKHLEKPVQEFYLTANRIFLH